MFRFPDFGAPMEKERLIFFLRVLPLIPVEHSPVVPVPAEAPFVGCKTLIRKPQNSRW